MQQASQRIDKWLWYARVTKSRTLAQKLAVSGHVRLNKEKVTTAKQGIKLGDVLTIALPRRLMVYKVLDLGSRRGPASEAQLLYEDLSPPPTPKEDGQPEQRDRGTGRPTKRDRRQLIRMKKDSMDDGF
ncbi:RNA-binding S4 domain-containing protein [Pseudovibrio sp. SPO723]|uniref:RNA-binding S4 domain-containing protein n=1 Tax=Nesiotobacter zosterae TaxID=392721 RepID=UPI0029C1D5DA|nr:RNA-binding S4 domain-containing protein [Pseudovibrio sp. SPO723]MDX5594787.1 RNA-binding S4 domain-containing protein [Pseudovibrio sp. SPO723]